MIIPIFTSTNLAFGQGGTQERWETANIYVYDGNYSDTNLPINYNISSGKVVRIIAGSDPFNHLWIIVNSSSPGRLMIELPRDIIDSRQTDGIDTPYNVFTAAAAGMPGGRKDADFQEIENTPDHRTLSIPYPVGTRNMISIYVEGTHAIPEFNGFGLIILGISMVTVLAMNAKFQRKFMS